MSSWHCPSWAHNVHDNRNDILTEGETAEDLYSQYRCDSFSGSTIVYVDAHDNIRRRDEIGPPESAFCEEHEREAEWNGSGYFSDDLVAVNLPHCDDCDLFFQDEDDLEGHTLEKHEEINDEFSSLRHLWQVA